MHGVGTSHCCHGGRPSKSGHLPPFFPRTKRLHRIRHHHHHHNNCCFWDTDTTVPVNFLIFNRRNVHRLPRPLPVRAHPRRVRPVRSRRHPPLRLRLRFCSRLFSLVVRRRRQGPAVRCAAIWLQDRSERAPVRRRAAACRRADERAVLGRGVLHGSIPKRVRSLPLHNRDLVMLTLRVAGGMSGLRRCWRTGARRSALCSQTES